MKVEENLDKHTIEAFGYKHLPNALRITEETTSSPCQEQ